MKSFVEGALKFQRHTHPSLSGLFKKLATTHNPKALFITCSDSRVVPELLTQQDPGDIFVIRNAGNIVPSHSAEPGGVTASVEYAVAALGVTDIVVCGHSDCGAMTAIATCACMDHMPAVGSWLRHADAAKAVNEARTFISPAAKLDSMVRENVLAQLANLKTHPSVARALAQGSVTLHGWVYDIGSGGVQAYDGKQQRFVALADHPNTVAEQSKQAELAA